MFEPDELRRWERNMTAMLAAAAAEDPEGFAAVVAIIDQARDELPAVAAGLRARHGRAPGYSWADIARALGVTRSAAFQRFGVVKDMTHAYYPNHLKRDPIRETS